MPPQGLQMNFIRQITEHAYSVAGYHTDEKRFR